MYCRKCGSPCADGAVFCENCGEKLNDAVGEAANDAFDKTVSMWQNAQETVNDAAQGVNNAAQNMNSNAQSFAGTDPNMTYVQANRDLPMNWHKFLVYFCLWAGAIINFLSGITSVGGGQYESYGVSADMIYSYFRGLKTADVIYGIALIGIAAFGFYTAYNLLKMKKGAPKLLLILYAVVAAVSVIYTIAVIVIIKGSYARIDTSSITASASTSVIISVIMIIINNIYYKKREHLFVN